jgi:hypothetical protein
MVLPVWLVFAALASAQSQQPDPVVIPADAPASPSGQYVVPTPPTLPENGSFAFDPFPSPAPFGRGFKEFDPSRPPPVEYEGDLWP